MKLLGKIFITGQIEVLTGLRIGGSKTSLDIGGIDLNVIKDPKGIPFIPGSSLKGKLRSILAREEGSIAITKKEFEKLGLNEDEKKNLICDESGEKTKTIRELFGLPACEGTKQSELKTITRLIVRDCNLLNAENLLEKKSGFEKLELDYTESKWETAIDRKTGAAKNGSLRQMERVPAGAVFEFELIYNVFSDKEIKKHLPKILEAMLILEDDYLGGCGSRGYGKIKFNKVCLEAKDLKIYVNENKSVALEEVQKAFELENEDLQKLQKLIQCFHEERATT